MALISQITKSFKVSAAEKAVPEVESLPAQAAAEVVTTTSWNAPNVVVLANMLLL